MKTTSLIVVMFYLLNPVSVGSQRAVSAEHPLNVASDHGPEQIVVRFFEIVVQGEFEKLPEMITNYPDEYFTAKLLEVELYSRSQGIFGPSSQPTDSCDSVKTAPTLKLQNSTTADDGFTKELILGDAKEFNNDAGLY